MQSAVERVLVLCVLNSYVQRVSVESIASLRIRDSVLPGQDGDNNPAEAHGRPICKMLLMLFSRTIIIIHVCVKRAFCACIINHNKVSVLPICASIIQLGRVKAQDTLQRGRSVHSTSFAGARGEQRELWMEPGCGEALALLQREMGSHLICCCSIAVREGGFSARGVSPRKRPYPQGAMVSTW